MHLNFGKTEQQLGVKFEREIAAQSRTNIFIGKSNWERHIYPSYIVGEHVQD